jgi:hypothetical protein
MALDSLALVEANLSLNLLRMELGVSKRRVICRECYIDLWVCPALSMWFFPVSPPDFGNICLQFTELLSVAWRSDLKSRIQSRRT